LIIAILCLGGRVFTIAVALVCMVGLYEFYGVFKQSHAKPFGFIGYIAGLAVILSTGLYGQDAACMLPAVIVFCTIACFAIMITNKSARINDLAVTLLGIVYISVIGSQLLLIRMGANGQYFIWLVFVIAWLGDTFAYFIGINFGKNKLCPDISPKKSVEGAIGGLMGSIIGSLAFGYMIGRITGTGYQWIHYLILGTVGGIFAQLGDLSASLIKRATGVKDFGFIIPGHGGILDRFDSILFTAPIVYYYMILFVH
jgi:phosphatidate cytidylyltransferase